MLYIELNITSNELLKMDNYKYYIIRMLLCYYDLIYIFYARYLVKEFQQFIDFFTNFPFLIWYIKLAYFLTCEIIRQTS